MSNETAHLPSWPNSSTSTGGMQLRPRLDGLTDDEYFWQPVPNCWTVHPDGGIDFAYPPPQPEPVTTIAWRMAHVIVGVLAMRVHSHFGGPPADYQSWDYATDAAHRAAPTRRRLPNLERRGTRPRDADLAKPCGPAEGPYADESMTTWSCTSTAK